MRKIFTLLVFSFFFANLSSAQIDTTILINKTQEYINSYMNDDFKSMAMMAHPNLLSLGGGVEWVSKDLETDKSAFKGFGFDFLEGKAGTPETIYQNGSELLCFVPQKFIVKVEQDKFESTSYLLASSSTKGESWSFVSLDRFDASSIKDFIPNYLDEMTWPETLPMVPITD